MLTTEAHGTSLDNLIFCSVEQVELYEENIRQLLLAQPKSWEHLCTVDELIEKLKNAEVFAILYVKDEEPIALMVAAMYQYGELIKSLKIEFVTCARWFYTVAASKLVEDVAVSFGVDFIEAIAHPTLGNYAVRKLGFDCQNVYITKQLPRKGWSV